MADMELKQLGRGDLGAVQALFVKIFSRAPWNDHWDDREQLRLYMEELLGAPNSLPLGLFEGDVLTGISLGVNLLNALVIGILGVPGLGLLLLVQWLFT